MVLKSLPLLPQPPTLRGKVSSQIKHENSLKVWAGFKGDKKGHTRRVIQHISPRLTEKPEMNMGLRVRKQSTLFCVPPQITAHQ